MKNLIKKFGRSIVIAGLSLALFSCGSNSTESKSQDDTKSGKMKFAESSDYLGIEFITNPEQVEVSKYSVQLYYPNKNVPHFRVFYGDDNKDFDVDIYLAFAEYAEYSRNRWNVDIARMFNKKAVEEYKLDVNPTYIPNDLQKIINEDYKELRKKYSNLKNKR